MLVRLENSLYDAELEKRVKSNMESCDVKELWKNKLAIERYNIEQGQRNAANNSDTRRPRTASLFDNMQRTNVSVHSYEPPGMSNNKPQRSNLWYLDLFNTDLNSSIARGGSTIIPL